MQWYKHYYVSIESIVRQTTNIPSILISARAKKEWEGENNGSLTNFIISRGKVIRGGDLKQNSKHSMSTFLSENKSLSLTIRDN